MSGCSEPPKTTNPVHPHFTDTDGDVTFQSFDGIQFQLQRKYLESNTGAFPGAEFDTRGEITHLTESASVLELLFQFVYPKRQPDIEEVEFKLLAALAEAAEKYEVFSAMEVCKLHMKRFLPQHSLEVLMHATKHDYPKLIQETIRHLARSPLTKIADVLPSRYVVPWVHYHDAWNSIFEDALKGVLGLRIASPNTGARQGGFFASSLQPQICHACLLVTVSTIQEFKAIESIPELETALGKARPPILGCMSTSCQYTTAASKIYLEMKTKAQEIVFSMPVSSQGY